MKISNTDKEITIIEFTKAELEGCSITYENISRDKIRSKSVISAIINEAAKISDSTATVNENTLIDILPDGEGGCVIVLNNAPKKRENSKEKIFVSSSFDCVLDFAKAVKGRKVNSSSLYEYGKEYFLFIEADEETLKLCSEFLHFYSDSPVVTARLKEYGQLMIESRASEVLGGTASEK